jgi:hypothetical protein
MKTAFLWLAASLLASAVLPTFRDIAAPARVDFKNQADHTRQKYLLETMGGGAAVFDYNNDGRLDLFFVNGAALSDPMPAGKMPDKSNPRYWNRLYRNLGDGTFVDVTEAAGLSGRYYGMGAAVGDYDNDGYADLYVTAFGGNTLYHNNRDGTFKDITAKSGAVGGGWSTGAAFFDYDKDGNLDIVVARYLDWDFKRSIWCGDERLAERSYCHPDHFEPALPILYRNRGDGTFQDVSDASGIGTAAGKGLGIAINDYDRDGWPDIAIANDSFPQQLFRNKHDGTFEELGLPSGMAFDDQGRSFAGMGIAFDDYDNDGWPDIFVNALSYQKYALFRNTKGSFEYVSGPSGVGRISLLHSGWGAGLVDYDNDGWKDLFVGQGHSMDTIQKTQPALSYFEPLALMRNVEGKFDDVGERSGAPFRKALAARGVAFGDLNNDGFLDIVINCNSQPAVLLQNSGGNRNHWLIVNTIGTSSNRDGMGAALRLVTADGMEQSTTVQTAVGYLSASDKRVHFGLGLNRSAKLLEISWPSGVIQRIEGAPADKVLTVREPAPSGPAQ